MEKQESQQEITNRLVRQSCLEIAQRIGVYKSAKDLVNGAEEIRKYILNLEK